MVHTYFLNLIMGNVFGSKTTPEIPSAYYVGLSSTNPQISVTEPVGNGYTRVACSDFTEPVDGVIKNSNTIFFPESTGSWGTLSYYAVFSSASSSDVLFSGSLSPTRTIESGTSLAIKQNELKITLSNGNAT